MLGGRSMAEYTKVALDAMGGDYAPAEIIKGAVDAVNTVSYTHLTLPTNREV